MLHVSVVAVSGWSIEWPHHHRHHLIVHGSVLYPSLKSSQMNSPSQSSNFQAPLKGEQTLVVLEKGQRLKVAVDGDASQSWLVTVLAFCLRTVYCSVPHLSQSAQVTRIHHSVGPSFTVWPLRWKTWKSQGIPKWLGKSQGKLKSWGKRNESTFKGIFALHGLYFTFSF